MKKILKWIKEHVRPYYKYNKPKDRNEGEIEEDLIDDLKENSEIGVKIKFKF